MVLKKNKEMSQTLDNNKRIAKNTLLLYFCMLFMMGVSLYTSRVVLNTLGVEDYCIYNIVGGVVAMFATMQQIYNIRQKCESKGHFYELFFALSLPPVCFSKYKS